MTSAYDVWMAQYIEDGGDEGSHSVRQAFLDYLNGTLDSIEAARRCTQGIGPMATLELTCLWHLFFDVATTFTKDQDRLIRLLQSISQLPDVMENGEPVELWGRVFWSGLPMLGWELYDTWSGSMSRMQDSKDEEAHNEYINILKFTARICASSLLDMSVIAQRSFSQALEKDWGSNLQVLGTHMKAIKSYISIDGEALRRYGREELANAHSDAETTGEKAGRSHWTASKRRLADIRDDQDVMRDSRADANELLAAFECVEEETLGL